MKQQIVSEIKEKFLALGIPAQYGEGADVTVEAEFLDAKWSTGSKKIGYQASVFADEREQTVYMYEKTTEAGYGISMGFSGESSFQSGNTLFRKVKGIQWGPEGKAYEYNLDLGSVSKAVKESAKRGGWKFKTVLSRQKAAYPAGYTPLVQNPNAAHGFCAQCGAPLLPGARFCTKCGKPAGV